jgi:hypothetical protein
MEEKAVVGIRGGTIVGLYASDARIETHVVDLE